MTMTLDGVEDIAAMRERDGLKYPCPGRPAPGKTVEVRRPAIHWIRQPLPFQLNRITVGADS